MKSCTSACEYWNTYYSFQNLPRFKNGQNKTLLYDAGCSDGWRPVKMMIRWSGFSSSPRHKISAVCTYLGRGKENLWESTSGQP